MEHSTRKDQQKTLEVNIYYQEHRERIEIDMIGEQKWNVILGILWLACHNPKIDWRMGEVKIIRCPEEYRKQQSQSRESQGSRNRKKKKEKKKQERNKKKERKNRRRKRKTKVY